MPSLFLCFATGLIPPVWFRYIAQPRLKDWDEAGFIARMRTAKPSTPGSPMPWAPVATMTDDDLKAIWAYLASLEPVNRDTGPALK